MNPEPVCTRCGSLIHIIRWKIDDEPYHGRCAKLERAERQEKAEEAKA